MCALVGAALAAVPSVALAQAGPPFDPAIDVQMFEYAIGPKTFFTVSDADVADKKQLAVDALVTFMSRPFKIFNVDPANQNMITGDRTVVVESVTAAQLSMAYGLTEKLQLGAMLPVVFSMQGDGLDPMTGNPSPNGLSVTGLGDLIVEGKYRALRRGRFRVSLIGAVSLPSSFGSGESQFLGDDLPAVRARVAMQYTTGRLSLGANGGVMLRKPRTIYDSTIGQQLTWGASAAFRVTERFSLIGESFGRAGLPDFSLDASPLEAVGGMRIYVTPSTAVVLGGGAGLVKGIGSPEARFFVSLGYAPDVRDTDGDGIPNSRDKCPLIPEDYDGHEDDDGCPDDDSDGDRRPDSVDKCPHEPEDLDGFEDEDGCPELDNDKDGIPDLQDKCPNDPEDGKEPHPTDGCPRSKRDSDGDGINDELDKCPLEEEDLDGFEDEDGCPELDNDKDGIPDAQDKCPVCAEDKDGFEDEDGCPDLDNDKDGIPDAQDKCPNQPETFNGFKDDDGCPDAGAPTVLLDGDRLAITKLPTMGGRALSASGGQLVDQIASVMRGNPDVTKWLIALSHPKPAEAQILVDAIRARLVAKGVPADRIEVIGAAGPAKIGGVAQDRTPVDVAAVCTPVHGGSTPAPAPAISTGDGDRDGDDIIDSEDKCPDEPETINGYEDEDGCPDTVPTALKQFSGSVQGVNFKSGSAELLQTSLKVLDGAAKAFTEFPQLKVEIQGHTDDVPPGRNGKFPDNQALSQARAEAVKTYLVSKGVDGARLTPKGFGDSKPMVKLDGLKGGALNNARTKNRRVEFKLLN